MMIAEAIHPKAFGVIKLAIARTAMISGWIQWLKRQAKPTGLPEFSWIPIPMV
jgi:hypothetical protein